MFGLLKENGPFLVDVKELPDKEPFLRPNEFGWNKAAHVLYIDSPVGTGFSFANTASCVVGFGIKNTAPFCQLLKKVAERQKSENRDD